MADDEIKPPYKIPDPPEVFTIPSALLEAWGEIPGHERLNFPLTRQEIDHLLLGLLRLLEAQSTFEKSMIEWSSGRLDEANKLLGEFRRHNVDAQNNIRQLATAIMASATRERKNAK
jgi:hypothetical protein